MDISIDPKFQIFIENQVRAGRYSTPDDVINSALGHLAAQADFSPEEIEELKSELAIGAEQADRGEFVGFTADQIVREGRELLRGKQKAV